MNVSSNWKGETIRKNSLKEINLFGAIIYIFRLIIHSNVKEISGARLEFPITFFYILSVSSI